MKKLILLLLLSIGTLFSQAQTPTTLVCDSLDWTVLPSGSPVLILQGNTTPVFPATILNWGWSVCTYTNICYSEVGQTATFQQFTAFDTLKACLVTILDINSVTYLCEQCDTLVYDGFGGWMLMNMGNPTSIEEMKTNLSIDNKMYDILGREFINYQLIPSNTIYIKNKQKYIKLK